MGEALGIGKAAATVCVGLLAVIVLGGGLMWSASWVIEWIANWNWPDMRPN
jgi:hypothetical protein